MGSVVVAPDQALLANVGEVDRQLVVGDSIRHPQLGLGILVSGWEGHVEVQFQSQSKTFTDRDGYCLIPSDLTGEWLLLYADEADKWRAEVARQLSLGLVEIRACLQRDFISSDEVYKSKASRYVSQREYDNEKTTFVQRWVENDQQLGTGTTRGIPDPQQAMAISSVVGNVQVVARAGSGKTETVANRAVFLQKHCGVEPSEMLLLAFNRDAAKEMSERVASKLGGGALPHIMTFHALAFAIVPGAKQLLVNQSDGKDQSLNQEFQQVLMDAIENPEFEEKIRRLMLAHFRADWEKIASGGFNLSRDEMLKYRRSLASETLRGEYVKSYGEKVIANFLFEHDVPYLYEQNHWWSGRNYRPDFTIPKSGSMPKGIVVEYFGLAGDPDYDEQSAEKRDYWEKKAHEWVFVELEPKHLASGKMGLERILDQALVAAKVPIKRLSEDEIWHRARERSILRFTEAVSGFVGRCRKQWLTPKDLARKIGGYPFVSDIEAWFVEIAVEIYETYLNRLDAIGCEDFDGLMQQAVSLIGNGKSTFSRNGGDGDLRQLRYVFVDEYQDFTELFHRMIASIRQLNPDVTFFCVGDDWQAINRFAGSDLKYYREFSAIFDPAATLGISTNRRSARDIVNISNALMHGFGDPASAGSVDAGQVMIVDLAKFKPSSLEESLFKRSLLTPAVLRLAGKALADGKSVVLLSAKNTLIDPSGGMMSLDRYLKRLKAKLPVPLRDGLSISTAHGFKGNQSDVVIVLDALERNYPLIHPNWVFARILGESIDAIVDESRRLFYVALTRAKEQLFIVTESKRESPFLDEIRTVLPIAEIDWKGFPPVMAGNDWITVKILGDYQSVSPLIDSLKADGFRYRDLSRSGGERTWDRSYRLIELDDGFLVGSPWLISAGEKQVSGVAVNLFDGMDVCVMALNIRNGELLLPEGSSYDRFRFEELKAAFGTAEITDVANPAWQQIGTA